MAMGENFFIKNKINFLKNVAPKYFNRTYIFSMEIKVRKVTFNSKKY